MDDAFAIPAASEIYLEQQEFLAVRAAKTNSRNQGASSTLRAGLCFSLSLAVNVHIDGEFGRITGRSLDVTKTTRVTPSHRATAR
jgi:hypothetical protein